MIPKDRLQHETTTSTTEVALLVRENICFHVLQANTIQSTVYELQGQTYKKSEVKHFCSSRLIRIQVKGKDSRTNHTHFHKWKNATNISFNVNTQILQHTIFHKDGRIFLKTQFYSLFQHKAKFRNKQNQCLP